MLTKNNVDDACCALCLYFRHESPDYGRCHCHTPRPERPIYYPLAKGQDESWMPHTEWPIVMTDDVCRNFNEK